MESTGVDKSGHYLSPKEDRQVGLGILGLANHLAIHGVTYAEFGDALEVVNATPYPSAIPLLFCSTEWRKGSKASYDRQANRMERAFTIAPTATCSYNYTDLRGNTTCPEIAPQSPARLTVTVPPLVSILFLTATLRLPLKSATTHSYKGGKWSRSNDDRHRPIPWILSELVVRHDHHG